MTKMIKLSLAAAVAVSALTTSASAQNLEDAIKGVEFSGSVEYRMETRDTEYNTLGTSTHNPRQGGENARIVLAGKTKVNDSLAFNAKAVLNSQANSTADSTGNTQGPLNVNVAKFTYTADALTVTAGMQELATPWTDAADGARANGVLATYAVGPVTVAAAYFRDSQMGIDKNADLDASNLGALALIGTAGPVSYQAWYLNIAAENDTSNTSALKDGGSAVALLANAKFGPVAVDASYASLKGDNNTLKTQTLSKVIVSGNVAGVTLIAGIADGGKDGDLVTFDSDAKVGFESWMIRAGQAEQADLSAYTAAVVVPVGPVSLKFQYTDASFDDARLATVTTDVDEMLVQATYKMSKNFTAYLRYAQLDGDDKTINTSTSTSIDLDRTRLSLKYTF